MNITVEGNRITRISSAGTPGVQTGRQGGAGAAVGGRGQAPATSSDQYVVDAQGMYLMPGFIDMHVHAGGAPKNAEAEYAYKLWLAHGVTTVRGVPLGPHEFTVKERARSDANEIVAPRIINYQRPGQGWTGGVVNTPEKAREWVRWGKANGIDGLKLGAEEPAIMAALLDEAKKLNMGSTAHLQQSGVAQMNAIQSARLGLQTVTHFYGHFEALLKDYVVQPWPVDMNASDEQQRFGQVARLWNKIHEPGSPEWKAYLAEHLKLGTCLRSDPDDLLRRPRRHAVPRGGMARQVHAAVTVRLLRAEPDQSRLVLV
jgi:imidazolonepropionase-like amidohydrolase